MTPADAHRAVAALRVSKVVRCAAVPIAFSMLGLAACGRSGDSPSADACAAVVGQFKGAPDRVAVRAVAQTEEGQVDIDYEYTDRENIPVTGSAACTFAVGDGSLELIDAIVDGRALDAAEVTAANRAL